MRQTGTVEVEFTILSDGTIGSARVIAPCRYRKLNKAALHTLERVGRFPPIPDTLNVSELSICVPIRYTLK
jgi:protein TonB